MTTLVCLHAHPDDEAIFTGGTLAPLAAAGHRTVVVLLTNGDEDPQGALAEVRAAEARTACARLAATPTVYEATVDREYLHFVETHLVGHAVESLLGMEIRATNAAPLGVPTVEVSVTVDVRPVIDLKRSAMSAHASQIAADSETLTMAGDTFEGVYGFEWFVRARGPATPLESLAF